MKKLELRRKEYHGTTVLMLQSNMKEVVLNVGYEYSAIQSTWHGMYLTQNQARKVRDWLDAWLKEMKGKRND